MNTALSILCQVLVAYLYVAAIACGTVFLGGLSLYLRARREGWGGDSEVRP